MNLLQNKKIIGLPVYTQSNFYLGKISAFEVDPISQMIINYHLKGNLIKKMVQGELIINREQVISLDEKKMIVEDNVIKEGQPVVASLR